MLERDGVYIFVFIIRSCSQLKFRIEIVRIRCLYVATLFLITFFFILYSYRFISFEKRKKEKKILEGYDLNLEMLKQHEWSLMTQNHITHSARWKLGESTL